MTPRLSHKTLWIPVLAVALATIASWADLAGQRGQRQDPSSQPFRGVTTDGTVVPGLFPVKATSVATDDVRTATLAFLDALAPAQRSRTVYQFDDIEWRLWNNVHRYARQGVSFKEMTGPQRELAFAMMRAGLSAKGFERSRNVMRLNGYLADLMNNQDEYGEYLYFLTVMGTPSPTEPWGWQLDGHHLVVNYFVMGDQVVMTPTFMGSEPVTATTGQYAGASVMQDEERAGLAFMRSLSADQQRTATINPAKTANNARGQAFQDNLTLPFEGIRGSALTPAQREGLLVVVGEYAGNMDDGHAKVKLDEVRAHLDDTYFAWIGGTGPDDVFYYRVHSPVVLIEFDHQTPVALGGPRVPGKAHVHSVVRTPNGNDYGKDLLRQHYERFRGDVAHGHGR
jgi:hypothetical protein